MTDDPPDHPVQDFWFCRHFLDQDFQSILVLVTSSRGSFTTRSEVAFAVRKRLGQSGAVLSLASLLPAAIWTRLSTA